MRQSAVVFLMLGLLVVVATPAIATVDQDTRDRIEAGLRSKKYVAKVDLYDATVNESGEVDSEEDDEAIRAGFDVIINRVKFGSSSIRLKLKHPHMNEGTYVEFRFARPLSPDFSREQDVFDKMLNAVFSEKEPTRDP